MRKFLRGFVYAANGLTAAIKQERNLRFHLVITVFVYLLSFFYNFSKLEYCLITILVVSVISLELINSAIERCAYKPDDKHYMSAGAAKDMAAAGVLISCLGSVVCGLFLFWDMQVFYEMFLFFASNLWALVLLLSMLFLGFLFIFKFGEKKFKNK